MIARGYGMHLSEADLGSFEPMVAGLLASYDAVGELYAQTAPAPPAGRTWKRPERAENPLGAWYVQTEIQEQPDGPLAGRRVAVKDNIEVAHPGGVHTEPGRDRGNPAAGGGGDHHRLNATLLKLISINLEVDAESERDKLPPGEACP